MEEIIKKAIKKIRENNPTTEWMDDYQRGLKNGKDQSVEILYEVLAEELEIDVIDLKKKESGYFEYPI